MAYTPQSWTNGSATPLSAARLSVMEAGIAAAHGVGPSHVLTSPGTLALPVANRQNFRAFVYFPATVSGIRPRLRINNDTGANYGWRFQGGVGSNLTYNAASTLFPTEWTQTEQENRALFGTIDVFRAQSNLTVVYGRFTLSGAWASGNWYSTNVEGTWTNAAAITSLNMFDEGTTAALPTGSTIRMIQTDV